MHVFMHVLVRSKALCYSLQAGCTVIDCIVHLEMHGAYSTIVLL